MPDIIIYQFADWQYTLMHKSTLRKIFKVPTSRGGTKTTIGYLCILAYNFINSNR